MNLANLLSSSARSFPDRPAVSIGPRTLLDYRALARRSAALAASLRFQFGLKPSDRVAITMKNCPQYLEILFACWQAGLIAVPMNARLHARELAFMAEDCAAALVFASDAFAQELSTLFSAPTLLVPSRDYERLTSAQPIEPHETRADDDAWIFYTSGTTGGPKGAMLSHRNLMAMTIGYLADVDQLTPCDALLHLAATSHASGLFALSYIAKASNNILPESGGFDPSEVAMIIDASSNLSFFVPPTLLRRICTAPAIAAAQLGNVRTVLVGAAPIHADDLLRAFVTFGAKLWHGYGQGESPCTITAMSKTMFAEAAAASEHERLGSVGVARTGMTVRVADGNCRSLPPGEIGEVLVRGETVMSGYWNRPEATQEALHQGWLHTGDLGRMDERGFLTLLDRKKDLIISGGVNIYAREIEEVLLSHPAVSDVAVIGLPDVEWGESVAAIVVLRAGAGIGANELDELCLTRIGRFKRPKRYEFVGDLPKNAAGKVLKRELREQYASGR
jgi:long-chain acyl-CoA synthetase